ncbi:MAG: hypothetical protein WAW42_07485 [Candidatus Competibacteraceae bacterium]
MPTAKTDTLTARIDPALKQAVRIAAALERRSLSNMLEVMICTYCQQRGLTLPDTTPHLKPYPLDAMTA